jgi:hypothetical protein
MLLCAVLHAPDLFWVILPLLPAAPYLLFAQHLGASFDGYPKIQEYIKQVKGRTAVAQVLQLHEQAATYGNRNYFSGVIWGAHSNRQTCGIAAVISGGHRRDACRLYSVTSTEYKFGVLGVRAATSWRLCKWWFHGMVFKIRVCTCMIGGVHVCRPWWSSGMSCSLQ